MSTSNRVWNRIVLLVAAVLWVAAGAAILAVQVWPDRDRILDTVSAVPDGAASLTSDALELAGAGSVAFEPAAFWTVVAAIVAVLVTVWAIVHAATRGRGRTGDAAIGDDVIVDADAVEALYRRALGEHPDVVHVAVQAWRRRRAQAWRADVQVRPHARLAEVADRAADAARSTRAQVGVEAPFVVHLHRGVRARMSGTVRAH